MKNSSNKLFKRLLGLAILAGAVWFVSLILPNQPVPIASSAAALPGYFWLNLEIVTSGFEEPTGLTNSGDDRLFVLERAGVIKIVQNGQILPTPFLDISARVNSADNWEQGLLGLAFHPDYVNNGFFFVNYINLNSDSHISRFKVSDADPNLADPNSEEVVLAIAQPTVIHNGGGLAFGPDGYLYASLGDGGWLNDPQNQAQNTQLLLGKILRFDVGTAETGPFYTIPSDNPFISDPTTADEIWALGFRNPWRISFDRQTGDLFIGDVGNYRQEEVNFQPAGDPGGQNYGWRCYEGDNPFNLSGCLPVFNYIFPIHAYNQEPGCAVTGGYVYRGSQFPFIDGYYIFSDLCSGELWTLHDNGNDTWLPTRRGTETANISSFGESSNGEIYAVDYFSGDLYQLTAEEIENIAFAPAGAFTPLVATPTPIPPGPDLVVTDLTIIPISPSAGVPAEIVVTVQNQGTLPVNPGNNFYIDFYINTVPVLYSPGVFFWGAQGSQFGVGESRSFSQDFSFIAGAQNLYVQVDTDQSVVEINEQNNILGPQVVVVNP